MTDPSQRPQGLDALASVGDWIMQNGRITAVIDDISPSLPRNATTAQRVAHNVSTHTHHLAPSGGTLIDLAPNGGIDHLNQVFQITGIVPRDAVHYTSLEARNEEGVAVVIARGTLDGSTNGDTQIVVTTRYELRPCDPGIRVRTELHNRGRIAWSSIVSDAWFWGDRSETTFVPGRGMGFRYPALDLLRIEASSTNFPFMAAVSHTAPDTAYATIACDRPLLRGVNDPTISAVGPGATYVAPGDGVVFERMIFAEQGPGLAGAVDHAMTARAQLFDEPFVRVTGSVAVADTRLSDERVSSVVFYEPGPNDSDAPEAITPWSEAVPDVNGRYSAILPANRAMKAQFYRLGRPYQAPIAFQTPASTSTPFELPLVRHAAPGRVRAMVRIEGAPEGSGNDAELILVPTGDTQAESVRGSVYGYFANEHCAPYLGPTHGASPGCNRVLMRTSNEFIAPPGTYWLYAQAGPQRTLARVMITVTESQVTEASLTLRPLQIFPQNAMSADFHVHGGRSFDTAFPDTDRVMSLLANGVDLIAATDHDVTTSYGDAINALRAQSRLIVQPGVEMTPLIPSQFPPGATLPRTVGHFNAWPIGYNPALPRNGAPWDELMQPGELFDLLRPIINGPVSRQNPMGSRGIIQLNHPYAGAKIGRDEGYFRTIRWNPTTPVPTTYDPLVGPSLLVHRPGGTAGQRNIDFDTLETMQGVGILENLRHRQGWYGLLNSGHLRAGTADSDSHSLAVDPMGYPRNVVLGIARANYTPAAFNALVRRGAMVGTNGPFIDAQLVLDENSRVTSDITSVRRVSANTVLEITVRAAPWVPVDEVRVIANGQVIRTIREGISRPTDAFGVDGVERITVRVTLGELGLGARDAWLVVEAGVALPTAVDSDNDGLLDHADFNGDGNATELEPTRPSESDPRFHCDVVVPGMYPWGFTNPFILDFNGGGWQAPNP
ncbi:MAG: hypothetical protein Q8Q09_10750 [Deltaproteobacteria bacterium]|nr:hypothetical protein [Deltaproteobacteria bacterium]